MTDTQALMNAIIAFEKTLPGWWWSVGTCSISRDASCGPDRNGPDAHLLFLDDPEALSLFDGGFHVDLDEPGSTTAQALTAVMDQAIEARAQHGNGSFTWSGN